MIVVYDGGCGICGKAKTLLEKLDWFNAFKIRPLHEDNLYTEFPDLNKAECEEEIKLILNNGTILGGADAVIRICFYLPLLFWWGWIWWLPPFRQIARKIYPWVAKNRHLISSACKLD